MTSYIDFSSILLMSRWISRWKASPVLGLEAFLREDLILFWEDVPLLKFWRSEVVVFIGLADKIRDFLLGVAIENSLPKRVAA